MEPTKLEKMSSVQFLEPNKGTLFIIAACSGTGKTSLVKEVSVQLKTVCKIERIITYTTRAPRSGEIDGHDYYFVSELEFKCKMEEGFFLEWSTAYGAYYGSPRHEFSKLAQGISLLLILDQDGFAKVLSLDIGKSVIGIWITTPSFEILEKRLLKRGDDQTDLVFRLALAKQETENTNLLALFKHKLINEKEQEALKNLAAIIKEELSAQSKLQTLLTPFQNNQAILLE